MVCVRAVFERGKAKVSVASSMADRPVAGASVPSLGCVRPAISVYPRSMSRPDTAQARCADRQTQACLFTNPGLVAQPVKYKQQLKSLGKLVLQ